MSSASATPAEDFHDALWTLIVERGARVTFDGNPQSLRPYPAEGMIACEVIAREGQAVAGGETLTDALTAALDAIVARAKGES